MGAEAEATWRLLPSHACLLSREFSPGIPSLGFLSPSASWRPLHWVFSSWLSQKSATFYRWVWVPETSVPWQNSRTCMSLLKSMEVTPCDPLPLPICGSCLTEPRRLGIQTKSFDGQDVQEFAAVFLNHYNSKLWWHGKAKKIST